MSSTQYLRSLIQISIDRLKENPEHNGEVMEKAILHTLKENHGYNHEEDQETVEYCLKATQIEIWEYYLKTVLPKIENK